jgi:uncharacterized protein YdgA (DUF945 family)
MRLVDERYERGWFRSRALAELEQAIPTGGIASGATLRVRVASRILHGPWHLDAFRLMPAAAIIESRVDASAAGAPGTEWPPVLLSTRVELDGRGRTRLRIPPMERPAGLGVAGLRMPESGGEMSFAPGFQTMEAHYELASLGFEESGAAALAIEGLNAGITGARGTAGLFLGRGGMNLEKVRVRRPDGEIVFRGLSFGFESTSRERLVDLRLEYGLDSLEIAGASYGGAKLMISVSGLPAEELADLRRGADELPVDPSTGTPPPGLLLSHFLSALLSSDPEITIDHLEVGTPNGKVEARLSLGTRGMTREAIERPGAWLSHLRGEAELRLPKTLLLGLLTRWHRDQALAALRKREPELAALTPELEKDAASSARTQLDMLVRDGWAVEQAGQVEAGLRLADAMLTINGKTFPLNGLSPP